MNKWLCRILIIIFLVNTLPVGAEPRRQFNQQKLEDHVINYGLVSSSASIRAILEHPDPDEPPLTSRERTYLELDLQEAQAFEVYADTLPPGNGPLPGNSAQLSAKIRREAQAKYDEEHKRIEKRKRVLEKADTLVNFYEQARSEKYVAASVYALRQLREKENAIKKEIEEKKKKEQEAKDRKQREQTQLYEQSHPKAAMDQTAMYQVNTPGFDETSVNVLALWEKDEITVEDLVEYIDPGLLTDNKENTGAISDAAQLLWYHFLHANMSDVLDKGQTKENAVWLALRLKYRIKYQLFNLQNKAQGNLGAHYLQARGNLTLLYTQVQTFLNNNYVRVEAQANYDRNLPEYELIAPELGEWDEHAWDSIVDINDSFLHDVQVQYASHPSPGSLGYTNLAENISFLTTYLLFQGSHREMNALLHMVNQDATNFHGYNDMFVSSIFASMYEAITMLPLPQQTQEFIKSVLVCAAAPKCQFGKHEPQDNAVNMRTQALALASMLRQETDVRLNTQSKKDKLRIEAGFLRKGLFSDQAFRTKMAAYTIDLYAPTTEWNAGFMGYKGEVAKYGMSVDTDRRFDELTEFNDHLAFIFETFLPVPEPTSVFTTVTEGPYMGCTHRVVQKEATLSTIQTTGNRTVDRKHPVFKDGTENPNLLCKNEPSILKYRTDTALVYDSQGKIRSITRTGTNPAHATRVQKDWEETIVKEAIMWYIWGAAAKGLGLVLKMAKTALMAGKTAFKFRSGFNVARFQSKYRQLWKFQTNAWQKEMGITKMTHQTLREEGDVVYLEMARPGKGRYAFKLQGENLNPRTLKGRVNIRKGLRREIDANYDTSETALDLATPITDKTVKTTVETAPGVFEEVEVSMEHAIKTEQKVVASIDAGLQPLAEGDAAATHLLANPTGEEVVIALPEQGVGFVGSVSAASTEEAAAKITSLFTTKNARGVRMVPLESLGIESGGTFTGNIIGLNSGKYYGTLVVPETQPLAAYNIASAIAEHEIAQGSSLGLSTAYRYIGKEFKLFREAKHPLMTALKFKLYDPFAYQFYLKPYQESVEEEQAQRYAKQYGLEDKQDKDKKGEEQEKPVLSILDQIQNMHPAEDTSWAYLTTMFSIANRLANTILPQEIQDLRRGFNNWLGGWQERLASKLPNSLDETIKEYIMIPVEVVTMPAMIVLGDPTPAKDDPVLAADIREAANSQHVDKAVEGRELTRFKKGIDAELQRLLDDKKDLKRAEKPIPTLAKYQTQINKIYNAYEAALKEAKALVDTDAEKASEVMGKGAAKFVKEKSKLIEDAVHVQLQEVELPQTIQSRVNELATMYGEYFLEEDKQKLSKALTEYFKHQEPLVAKQFSVYTQKEYDDIIQKRIDLDKQWTDKIWKEVESPIDRRFAADWIPELDKQIRKVELAEQEELKESKDLSILSYLDNGNKNMKQIYRTYRSLLQRIREQADTDAYVSWVEAMDARDKFLESKKQLKTDAVKAFTATEMPAQIKKIEENKNLSPQTKHTLIEMYQKFYAEYEPLLIEYYTAHEVALQAGKPEEFARLFAEEAKQIAYAQMNQLVQNRKAEEEKILNSTTPQ